MATVLTKWARRTWPLSRPSTPGRADASFSPLFLGGVIACAVLVMAWRLTVDYPTQLFDFYPLYYGAKAWSQSGNAYDITTVAPVADSWNTLYQVGNIYPLPLVLVLSPLSLLPAKLASVVWLGGLVAALLLALRLARMPVWLVAYFPIVNGINLEQATAFILICQILALWAYRAQRPWVLALCCALMVAKPNQGLLFALCLVILARNWRQQLLVGGAIWGGTLLLDPNWVLEWLPTLTHHREVMGFALAWQLALLALPLFLTRNFVGGATMLQFALLPLPPAAYPASALPLSLTSERRAIWLIPLSFLWPFVFIVTDAAWATALTLMLPLIVLDGVRWWRERRKHEPAPPAAAPDPVQTGGARPLQGAAAATD